MSKHYLSGRRSRRRRAGAAGLAAPTAGLAAAGVAAFGLAPLAVAQSTLDGPAIIEIAPQALSGEVVVAQPQTHRFAPRVVEAGAGAALSQTSVRALSRLRSDSGERVLRLSGEEAEATLSLFLPEGVNTDELRLRLRNSITVLPERSQLFIEINGVALEPFQAGSFDAFSEVSLQTSALRSGENLIRLAARQHHRIYCGLDASYTLWTEVDLAGSGAVWPSSDLTDEATAFRAAMQTQLAQGRSIELRVADGAPPALLRRIASAISTYTGVGSDPAVRPATLWTASDEPALARVTVTDGPTTSVDVRRGGDGAAVLLISTPFETAADQSALFEQIDAFLPDALQAPATPAAEPGAFTTLADLGLRDSTHSSHVFARTLTVDVPEDWLILDEREAELTLRTREWGEAHPNAVVTLAVNEQPAGSFRLERGERTATVERALRFEANLLKPGRNELTLRGQLPVANEFAACPALDDPVLEISSASTLFIPRSPLMVTPGVERSLLGLSGDTVELVAGGGLGADALVSLASIGQATSPTTPTRLYALSVDALGSLDLGDLGVSRGDLRRALTPPTLAASSVDGEVEDGPSQLAQAASALAGLATDAVDVAMHGDGALDAWLADIEAEAILLQPRLEEPNTLWVVLGARVEPAAVAAAISRGRGVAEGPQGQVAALTSDGTWKSWRSPAAHPQLLEPLSSDNAVAVAGAYASWAPGAFALGGIGFSWICALIAVFVLRASRPRGVK